MRAKKLFALLLAGSMMASVLTGCWGGKKDDSSSGTDGDSDITWTDPDYDEDEDAPVAEYTIAVDVGDYGTVKPASPIKVKAGDTATFTVTANEGWLVDTISIDGKQVYPKNGGSPAETVTLTMKRVSKNHIVKVTYIEKTYTVSVNSNEGGDAKVSSDTVKYGQSASVVVTTNNGYKVASVTATMDGVEVNDVAVSSDKTTYTVNNVTGDVKFEVIYEQAKFGVTVIVGEHGNVRVNGDLVTSMNPIPVAKDSDVVIEVEPDDNYSLASLTVNGDDKSKGVYDNSYVVKGLSEDIKVEVKFKFDAYLTDEEVQTIENYFKNHSTKNQLKDYVDISNNKDLQKEMKNADRDNGSVLVDGTNYKYQKATVTIKDGNVEAIQAAIDKFYSGQVFGSVYSDPEPVKVEVYMEIDQKEGTCTMWVAYLDK